jgi:predicted phosphodiesterase
MRLAVIADVHGNLPALEAVIADIRQRGADAILNLGDCVSGPLWPRETMDLLDTLQLPTVRGNHDRWVAETPRDRMYPSDAFAWDRLTPAQRAALGALPARLDLGNGVAAVHGTPRDDNEYLLETVLDGRVAQGAPDASQERLGALDVPFVLCAHSHLPRLVQGHGGRMILNPGSVGCPAYADPTPPAPHVSEAGSPHARYAMITRASGRANVDLIALPYAWDEAAKRAADNGRAEWARALATGFVR